jgi:hypothetical protein
MSRHWWLMPIILTIERLRLGGSWFQASSHNSSQDPISINSWMWCHLPVIPVMGEIVK